MKLRDLSKRMDYERILEEQRAEAEYRVALNAVWAEFQRDIAPTQQKYGAVLTEAEARFEAKGISLREFGAIKASARIDYAVDTESAREKCDAAETELQRVFREKMAAIQKKYSFLECYQDDPIMEERDESTPVD